MTRSGIPPSPEDDPGYSATELASHWFSHDAPTVTEPAARPPTAVLRFGPGVPSRPRPAPAAPARPARRPWPYRYALAAAVLLAVLGYLAWQRLGPPLAVENVTLRTDPERPGCDSTADVVARVTTNGAPGTLTYRWTRSDGTESEVLEEKLTKGQRAARLHLLWSFRGEGTHEARATLRITAPQERTATARFTYSCD